MSSFLSSSSYSLQNLNFPETETFFNQPQLDSLTVTEDKQFLNYTDNSFDYLLNTFLDPFHESDNFLLPYQFPTTFEPEDSYYNLVCPNPKRIKCNNGEEDSYSESFKPETVTVEVDGSSYDNGGKKMNMEKRRLSAQSVAARERRRKIADKTKELGGLIPGGKKMNTSEMLEAAFKYVKYLQAQLAVLQFLFSSTEDAKDIKELKILGSASVQEKLYMEEKCLVPCNIAPISTD